VGKAAEIEAAMKYITTINDREYAIEILDECHLIVDGKMVEVDFGAISDQPVYSMLIDGRSYEAYVYPDEENWQVLLHGRLFPALVEDEREKRLRSQAGMNVSDRVEFQLKAPMPGLVISIPVSEGQDVQKGDVLVILESMKMQNELKSPRAGTISRIRIRQGDSVEQRENLLVVV
jgi:biotin carboxyl carrier protein